MKSEADFDRDRFPPVGDDNGRKGVHPYRSKHVEVGRYTPLSDSETRCVSLKSCEPNITRGITVHSPDLMSKLSCAAIAGLFRPTSQGYRSVAKKRSIFFDGNKASVNPP